MNKDIKTMIDLQRYWSNVISGINNINNSKKSISNLQNGLEIKKHNLAELEKEIKNVKVLSNQNEIELSEKEEHIKKLGIKRDNIKTEKESKALDHEFEKAKADKDTIENNLIALFDIIEEKEKIHVALVKDIKEMESRSIEDIKKQEENIIRFQKLVEENQNHFDQMIDQLSPNTKPKFLKLIKSQNGIGIAKIEGQICGACNFQVPFNLTQDISKKDSIVICTNCGRFLYS